MVAGLADTQVTEVAIPQDTPELDLLAQAAAAALGLQTFFPAAQNIMAVAVAASVFWVREVMAAAAQRALRAPQQTAAAAALPVRREALQVLPFHPVGVAHMAAAAAVEYGFRAVAPNTRILAQAASAQSVLSGPVRRAHSHRQIRETYKCPIIQACGASPNSFKVAVRDCGQHLPARLRLARLQRFQPRPPLSPSRPQLVRVFQLRLQVTQPHPHRAVSQELVRPRP